MNHIKRLLSVALLMFALVPAIAAEDFSAKEVVLEHIKDSHDWHVTDLGGGKSLVIPLPIIVNSSTGWHVFCSSKFEHHADANGLRQGPYGLAIATEGDNAGKIVENGEPVLDLSITKTVAVMFINVAILLCCILFSARWYKNRKASDNAPGGFVGFVEMLVMYVVDDIIKPGVGKGYEKYTPYLLTCFFFIFTCNVMGLIPFPPGSGNVTGNIAVTFFLALCTFLIVQFSGNKHYWKDIFWPDVPSWLKAPIPIIPVIEFVGIFTKPFALGRTCYCGGYHVYYLPGGCPDGSRTVVDVGTERHYEHLHDVSRVSGLLHPGDGVYHALGRLYRFGKSGAGT